VSYLVDIVLLPASLDVEPSGLGFPAEHFHVDKFVLGKVVTWSLSQSATGFEECNFQSSDSPTTDVQFVHSS